MNKQSQALVCMIEGNIGAGKSTFLKIVREYLNVQVVFEPHERWQNVGGHNLLNHFYKDMKRWAYTFQSYAFISRVQTQAQEALKMQEPVQIVERSVFSDRYCFARNCYELGFMSELEWKLYQEWFSWLITVLPLPHAFIYLRTDPSTCYNRIQKRSRSEEELIDKAYLTKLHHCHEAWLIEKKEVSELVRTIPVLTLECSADFEHNQELQRAQVKQILAFLETHFTVSAEKVSRSSLL